PLYAEFARACETAGLIFLGPPASAIEALGSKSAAKALMEQAGVPLVPGYHGEAQDPETFRRAAEQIGYPVLLKAAAGGGGKGMKIVEREADLVEALQSAQREAQSSFGDARMLVEKYLLKDRKSTRLNSSHVKISYAVFCLKKKTTQHD